MSKNIERVADYRFLMSRLRRTGLDFVVVDKEPVVILQEVEDMYTVMGQF